MVPGFSITDHNVAEMFADLAEKSEDLDLDNSVVIIRLLDNSSFECTLRPTGNVFSLERVRNGNTMLRLACPR
jgi:hypothetical protein